MPPPVAGKKIGPCFCAPRELLPSCAIVLGYWPASPYNWTQSGRLFPRLGFARLDLSRQTRVPRASFMFSDPGLSLRGNRTCEVRRHAMLTASVVRRCSIDGAVANPEPGRTLTALTERPGSSAPIARCSTSVAPTCQTACGLQINSADPTFRGVNSCAKRVILQFGEFRLSPYLVIPVRIVVHLWKQHCLRSSRRL